MILSQTAGYALRAVLYLAGREGTPTKVDDVARELGVPKNYLSKILHTLARSGLLTSVRGPGGGFSLARPASDVTLMEVVGHFDTVSREDQCLLGSKTCGDGQPCAAHARWSRVQSQVRDFFEMTSVSELASMPGAIRTEAERP